MFPSYQIAQAGGIDFVKAAGSPEEREEAYQETMARFREQRDALESINHTQVTDRNTLTKAIRDNGFPSYTPDKLAMERRAALQESACRAVFAITNETQNSRGVRALRGAGIDSSRAMGKSICFAELFVPGGREKIDSLVSMADEFRECENRRAELKKQKKQLQEEYPEREKEINDREAEIRSRMEAVKGTIWKESVKYAQEHAAEFENLFAREITDEELVEKWPEYGIIANFYREAESFSDKKDKENSLLTQPMLARGTELSERMDYLSVELGGLLDLNELMKLSQGELREVLSVFPDMDDRANDIRQLYDNLGSQIRDQYMMGALQHFNIDPREGGSSLLLQDEEGNVYEPDSPEAWKLLHVRQEPVFAVPKGDPGAVPVLVQPLSREGFSATGNSFAEVTMPKIEPVEKPGRFVYGLHSLLKSVGKVFGTNLGLESCREYDKYAEKLEKQAELQKNLDRAAARYETLSSPERLKQASGKFAAHTGDTPESLQEKHEKFISENPQGLFQEKIREASRSIRELELRKIGDKIEALKESYTDKNTQAECERFSDELKQLAAESPSNRKLVTGLMNNNAARFLFETYRERKDEKDFSLGGFLNSMKGAHEIGLAEKRGLRETEKTDLTESAGKGQVKGK